MGKRRGISLAILLGLASISGLGLAEPEARAHEGRSWQRPVTLPAVSVTLVAGHGHALSTIHHRGSDFVVGERGERYEIQLHNNSASRMEVVVTVDGLDVVSGRAGDFTRQRGYVLEPFGTVTIDGFRTSLSTVAAFRFSGVGDSFAAQVGAPHNAGVIGVAAFKERAPAVARSAHGGSSHSGHASREAKAKKDAAPRAPGRSSAAPSSRTAPSMPLALRVKMPATTTAIGPLVCRAWARA